MSLLSHSHALTWFTHTEEGVIIYSKAYHLWNEKYNVCLHVYIVCTFVFITEKDSIKCKTEFGVEKKLVINYNYNQLQLPVWLHSRKQVILPIKKCINKGKGLSVVWGGVGVGWGGGGGGWVQVHVHVHVHVRVQVHVVYIIFYYLMDPASCLHISIITDDWTREDLLQRFLSP